LIYAANIQSSGQDHERRIHTPLYLFTLVGNTLLQMPKPKKATESPRTALNMTAIACRRLHNRDIGSSRGHGNEYQL
jgi:hypothetical protein